MTDDAGEGGAEEPLERHARHRLAESETGPPEDHADGHEGQGHVEAPGDGGERLREARPQDHQDEDQPHVVRFPDRADGVLDQPALGGAPLRPSGHQIPEAGAEVGPAEEGTSGDAPPTSPAGARPGSGPHGEEHAEGLGPGPGQGGVDRIPGAQRPPFGQEHDEGEPDP